MTVTAAKKQTGIQLERQNGKMISGKKKKKIATSNSLTREGEIKRKNSYLCLIGTRSSKAYLTRSGTERDHRGKVTIAT